MKKRIAVVALCFVLTALLCACTNYAPVSVNRQRVSKGIYAYFTDRAKAENPDADEKTVLSAAQDKLRRYVAVNSEFAAEGLKLDASDKKSLADSVDAYWHLYSDYYTKLGVTRQDYYNSQLSLAYEKALLVNYYSADGKKPVSDDELKTYFSENFVAFRTVTGFLTTVDEDNNAVSMSEAQKQSITDTFNSIAADVNENGTALLDASAQLQNVTLTEDIVVISATNGYPDGFYEKLKGTESGKASAFVIGDYIFCAQRYEILSDEYGLFPKYRTDCLRALKGEEFDSVVESWASAYNVESK